MLTKERTPARKRAALTPRNRRNAERLRVLRARLLELPAEVEAAFSDCRSALLAFCAEPPSALTVEAYEVADKATWPLQERLASLKIFREEAAELTRELRDSGHDAEGSGNVIRLFP